MRPRYDYPRYDISSFEIINNSYNNKDYEYQIARDNIQGNKFYNIKDISDKTDSFSTNRNQNPASRKSPIDIVPQFPQNLNLNLENISKKPSSFDDWLEELKRKLKELINIIKTMSKVLIQRLQMVLILNYQAMV